MIKATKCMAAAVAALMAVCVTFAGCGSAKPETSDAPTDASDAAPAETPAAAGGKLLLRPFEGKSLHFQQMFYLLEGFQIIGGVLPVALRRTRGVHKARERISPEADRRYRLLKGFRHFSYRIKEFFHNCKDKQSSAIEQHLAML